MNNELIIGMAPLPTEAGAAIATTHVETDQFFDYSDIPQELTGEFNLHVDWVPKPAQEQQWRNPGKRRMKRVK